MIKRIIETITTLIDIYTYKWERSKIIARRNKMRNFIVRKDWICHDEQAENGAGSKHEESIRI